MRLAQVRLETDARHRLIYWLCAAAPRCLFRKPPYSRRWKRVRAPVRTWDQARSPGHTAGAPNRWAAHLFPPLAPAEKTNRPGRSPSVWPGRWDWFRVAAVSSRVNKPALENQKATANIAIAITNAAKASRCLRRRLVIRARQFSSKGISSRADPGRSARIKRKTSAEQLDQRSGKST